MKVCFFGAYNPEYTRNKILTQGLRKNGVEVLECRTKSRFKFWLRYPILFCQHLRVLPKKYNLLFVPAFRHKDVPLAWLIGVLTSKPVVFDPFVSRYETKIIDQRKAPAWSLQAKYNFFIDRLALKFSDVILTDTFAHLEYYSREFGIARNKFYRVPLGVPEEIVSSLKGEPSHNEDQKSRFLVQFFGSFLPLQGVEYIVEAAKVLQEVDKDIAFELIGAGQTLPLVKDLIEKMDVKNVVLEGWLPFAKLTQKISSADICLGIFGNTEKAMRVVPNKIFQCLAIGKPVITGKTPAILEFFTHKQNIFLCEPASGESLAEAVIALKSDPDLRRKIAHNGYNLIQENFTPELIGKRLKEILIEISHV